MGQHGSKTRANIGGTNTIPPSLPTKVKNMFTDLLDQRQAQWDDCRGKIMGRLTELSEYFTGEKVPPIA